MNKERGITKLKMIAKAEALWEIGTKGGNVSILVDIYSQSYKPLYQLREF